MKPQVRRWTAASHPNPWEYSVPRAQESVNGHRDTWRHAFDRTLQLIADQT